MRCRIALACLVFTALPVDAYTGGPVRAVVDGFDPVHNRVYYSLWSYDEGGGAPQVYYFDLTGPKPDEPVRDKSLEHPETEPFVGVFPRNWYDLKQGLTKLHGLRDFEMQLRVHADSIGVAANWGETQYKLSVDVSAGNYEQSATLEAFCEPTVRVLGLYRIPGRPDLLAVVSRIGRAYGCEEVESPMLLQTKRGSK